MGQRMRWALGRTARTVVCAAVAAGICPALACATTVSDCTALQSALDGSSTGDTITLTQGLTCSNTSFNLPSHAITLEGSGTGATFDAGDGTDPILTGANVDATTIENLTFQNGSAAATGGAIRITGTSSPVLHGDRFFNNEAASGGGAVSMQVTGSITVTDSVFGATGMGNGAPGGGGASLSASSGPIQISNSTFADNGASNVGGGLDADAPSISLTSDRFASNSAGEEGGGAQLAATHITLTTNTFASNQIEDPLGNSLFHGGAGLSAGRSGSPPYTLTQTRNLFARNSMDLKGSNATDDRQGAGEEVVDVALTSVGDRFILNSIPGGTTGHEWGAGISFFGCAPEPTSDKLKNSVVAGNSITGGTAEGSGIYTGCPAGPIALELDNSTVSGNVAPKNGIGGIWGGGSDTLTLHNSIVNGNSGLNIFGYATITSSHSDACSGKSPLSGAGNICAAPKLVKASAGNVRETFSSPTIDMGLNSLVPVGITKDAYGVARIQARLKGGAKRVDMGAAEFPTVAAPVVKITKPAAGAVFKRGQAVHSRFTCTEARGGPGIASCKDGSGHASGRLINTATTGQHTYKVTAISKDGLKTTKTVTYTVKK